MSSTVSTRSDRILGVVVAAILAVSVVGAAGSEAKPGKRKNGKPKPSVTMMRFKLDNGSVTAGDDVLGKVKVLSGVGRNRVPFAGAELSVTVDGVEAGSLTTAEDGTAAVSLVAEEGEHVVKVVYAGDSGHRRAKRAQGYEAAAAVEAPVTEPIDDGSGTTP